MIAAIYARKSTTTSASARLWDPPLRIERLVRLTVGARMREEPNDAADRALRTVLVQRRAIQRAGWFN